MSNLHLTNDGYYTGDDVEMFNRVAKEVKAMVPNLGVGVDHTGGGIFCIAVDLPGGRTVYFGTADLTWGWQVNDHEGDCLAGGTTDIPSDAGDERRVAEEIVKVVRGWLATPLQQAAN